ncbi:MAG: class I SAM-dependent methyltransferase [Myxococcota bacterium]
MSAGGDAVRHYDAKYAHEAGDHEVALVAPTALPTDRYQACVSALLPRLAGGDVLEIGAGDGRIARSLAAAGASFASYTATELSSSRLAGLRARLGDDPRFRVEALDLDHPPDPGARYDAVLLVALVEHLFDPLRAMAAVRRWLRPGGFVYLDTPNVAKYTRRLKLLAGRFPSTASRDEGLVTYAGAPVDLHDEGHLHYFTFRSLSRMLTERCGFARVERVPYATGPRLLGARAGHWLARLRPELFSELAVLAYAGEAASDSSRPRASL